MKKTVFVILIMICCFFVFAKGVETFSFTDSCGRTVELPKNITKVVPSGAVATMVCSSIAPEYMCSVNSKISENEKKYLDERLQSLPATGQLYGSKATLNKEEILSVGAQVIIDLGSFKNGIDKDLDALQEQLGIPCIFICADLDVMADAFRTLGSILYNKADRGNEIANFIDETIKMAKENVSKIKEEERVNVVYTGGKNGLFVYPNGSSQANVLNIIGANNVAVLEKFSSSGNGNEINMEQLYNFNPDVIIFAPDSVYESVKNNEAWLSLDAIKSGSYYQVPSEPYNWLGNPPSLNSVLGVWWLGNKLYPKYFNYDVASKIQRAFKVLWNYELTREEALKLI